MTHFDFKFCDLMPGDAVIVNFLSFHIPYLAFWLPNFLQPMEECEDVAETVYYDYMHAFSNTLHIQEVM